MSEYRKQFPDALLSSDSYKQKLCDNHWDNSGDNHWDNSGEKNPNYGKNGKDNPRKTLKDREYWEEFFTVSLNYLTNDECFIPKEVNKN